LKKGDLGGFEKLQGERIYGKRYKAILATTRSAPGPTAGYRHLVGAMGLDELPDIMLQHRVTHTKMTAGVKLFFVEKKAIGAVKVAIRPGGFGQRVDAPGDLSVGHRKGTRDGRILEKLCPFKIVLMHTLSRRRR
jgi:hypothetical protein